jgi:biotin carboxyl carrier protein
VGKHRFTIDGTSYDVEVGPRRSDHVQVTVNGASYDVQVDDSSPTARPDQGGAGAAAAPPARQPARPSAATAVVQGPASPSATRGSAKAIRAPMAGLVVSVHVRVGDRVTAGDAVVVLEAMKMENVIVAATDGTVTEVAVHPQQSVQHGDLLIDLS